MGLVLLRATGTLLRMCCDFIHYDNLILCIVYTALEPYLEAGKIDLDKTYVIINLVGFCVIAALFICSAEK